MRKSEQTMNSIKHIKRIVFLVALIAPASWPLHAAMVTLYGDDVAFTFDDGSLFGTANVVGNSLIFLPDSFSAESLDGAGTVTAHETLIIDVMVTTEGFQIESLGMFEQGDYILDGANASVAASGYLQAVSQTTTCGFIACLDSNIFNAGPFTDTAGATSPWTGDTSIELADTTGWNSDTHLSVTFQNNLSAYTEVFGEEAYIEKKLGAIGLIVNPVPVPAAAWLFGSGLLALAGVARRRKH